MTQQEAMIILKAPLWFGDSYQIKAADLIATYERAVELVGDTKVEYVCDECEGQGEISCCCAACGHEHQHKCYSCIGSGVNTIDLTKASEEELKMVIETEENEL